MTNQNVKTGTKGAAAITETYETSEGCYATAVYTYVGPTAAPHFGSDWDQALDQHQVKVTLTLAESNGYSRPAYMMVRSTVFGKDTYDANTHEHIVTNPSVLGAMNDARQAVRDSLAPIIEHVAKREARMRERNRRLQDGKEGSPFHHED